MIKRIWIGLIVAVIVLGGFAFTNATTAADNPYQPQKMQLKAREMMPAPFWKIIVIEGKKVLAPPDEDFSLTVDVELWVVRGPNPIGNEAAISAWNAYHLGVNLPAASMGWLLASGKINNGCSGVSPAPAPAPQPNPQPQPGPGTTCKGNDPNPANPDSNPTVTLARGWYTIEEFDNSRNFHHFFAKFSDGTLVASANGPQHWRAWKNLSDSEECAKAEARRAGQSMKAQNPSWTVFGPDGEEFK